MFSRGTSTFPSSRCTPATALWAKGEEYAEVLCRADPLVEVPK
jgi:hypothetical protein